VTDNTSPDFDRFHREELPRLAAAGHAAIAAPAAHGLPPLTFQLEDGRAYTFRVAGDAIAVLPGGADDATVVRLSASAWANFVTERWTRYGLLYTGSIEFPQGEFADLCHWEPALRALFHGRPVYDPRALDLADASGAPLDLERSFSLDDDPAVLAQFLQATGYLHVRNVFPPAEIEALRVEVEHQASRASADDASSGHWTLDTDGASIIANLKYGAVGSSLLTSLHDDPRVRRIVDLAGERDLQANIDRNEGTKIIFKRPGATEGLVDLPLHTDCGMGFHPAACQMVLVGVHLDAGTPESGQLHVVAGSHRSTTPDPAVSDTSDWPIVALATEAGDCTVHFSHSLHAAPPPVGRLREGAHARRTAYLCFAPPSLFEALAPFEDLTSLMHGSGGINALPEQLVAGDR
jgi:Phytanoyl-CoA dioxygenase (PhyH)